MAVPDTFPLPRARRSHAAARADRSLLPLLAAAALAAAGAIALGSAASPAIPLVAIIACILVYALVVRPEWGVPIAVFLLWIDASGVASFYHGAPSSVAAIIPLLLVVPLGASILRGERLRLDGAFWWMVAILVAEIVSTVVNASLLSSSPIAPGQSAGVGRITKFLEQGLIIYLLLINVVRTPKALRSAAWAIIAGGAFLSVFTLGQDLLHRYDHSFFGFAQIDHAFFVGHDDSPRAQGPLADANYYAQILLPSFALAVVALFREPRRRTRVWAGVFAVLILVAMVFTYSRGAALAVGVLIVLLALFRYLRARHLIPLALVLGALLIAFPKYADRLSSISGVGNATAQVGSSANTDLSIQQRATENAAAWKAIQDHPLFGVGPGGFPLVYYDYAQKVGGALHNPSKHAQEGDQAGEAPQRAVPNILLSIPADQGVVGLVAFLGLMACTIEGLLRARRRWLRRSPRLESLATGYLLALAMYLVSGLFLALAFERYLWALVGLCGAAVLVLLRGEEIPEEELPSEGRRRPAALSYGRKWGRTSPRAGTNSAMRARVVRTPLIANEWNEHE